MDRNTLNYTLMLSLYERYKKPYSHSSFVLSDDEKIRIKGFSRQLKQTIESRKMNFSKVFEGKDRYQTGFITPDDVKQVLLNELYMDQTTDMLLFIRSLSPLNDNKISLNKLKTE